ncbi:MAG: hypothetical protein Q7R99_04255 [bacterium]|nr:hypothetical protein [bacterium]
MKTILIAILAVLSVVLAGVLGWQKLTQPETTPVIINQPVVNKPVLKQPVATTSDETAGWKVYKDNNFSFSIGYPQNWIQWFVLTSGAGGDPMKYYEHSDYSAFGDASELSKDQGHRDMKIGIQIKQNTNSETLDQLTQNGFNRKEVLLSGERAIKVTEPGIIQTYIISTLHNNFMYQIECFYCTVDVKESEIFDQILSTFKFIK